MNPFSFVPRWHAGNPPGTAQEAPGAAPAPAVSVSPRYGLQNPDTRDLMKQFSDGAVITVDTPIQAGELARELFGPNWLEWCSIVEVRGI